MSTKTKTKSTKSQKATATVKKSTKTKTTKKPTTKKKVTKKTCCTTNQCCDNNYLELPEIADEFPYGEGNPIVVRYYYAVNHDTKEKFVICGDELPIQIAEVIAEDNSGVGEIAIVKISSPIAWLITKVFGVETIDANDIISRGKNK